MEMGYLIGMVFAKVVIFLAVCFLFGAIARFFSAKHLKKPLLHSAFTPPAVAPAVLITLVICMAEFSATALASHNAEGIHLKSICSETMSVKASREEVRMCRSMMMGDQGAERVFPPRDCDIFRAEETTEERCA